MPQLNHLLIVEPVAIVEAEAGVENPLLEVADNVDFFCKVYSDLQSLQFPGSVIGEGATASVPYV
jgi:hypothetical protein